MALKALDLDGVLTATLKGDPLDHFLRIGRHRAGLYQPQQIADGFLRLGPRGPGACELATTTVVDVLAPLHHAGEKLPEMLWIEHALQRRVEHDVIEG